MCVMPYLQVQYHTISHPIVQWNMHLDAAPIKTSIFKRLPIATFDFLRVSIKTDGLTWHNHRQPGVDHQTNTVELQNNTVHIK